MHTGGSLLDCYEPTLWSGGLERSICREDKVCLKGQKVSQGSFMANSSWLGMQTPSSVWSGPSLWQKIIITSIQDSITVSETVRRLNENYASWLKHICSIDVEWLPREKCIFIGAAHGYKVSKSLHHECSRVYMCMCVCDSLPQSVSKFQQ